MSREPSWALAGAPLDALVQGVDAGAGVLCVRAGQLERDARSCQGSPMSLNSLFKQSAPSGSSQRRGQGQEEPAALGGPLHAGRLRTRGRPAFHPWPDPLAPSGG